MPFYPHAPQRAGLASQSLDFREECERLSLVLVLNLSQFLVGRLALLVRVESLVLIGVKDEAARSSYEIEGAA